MASPEVDICRGEVVDAFVISLVIVKIDEGLDLRFQICREEVVLQQDAVFQGLMPSFDLSLGLRMVPGQPDKPCPPSAEVGHFYSALMDQIYSAVDRLLRACGKTLAARNETAGAIIHH